MAIIKFSAIVSDARGKVGGNVFSRNKGGAYVRTLVKPNNPRTAFQTAVRQKFQSLTTGYRNLTGEQREAWEAITPSYPYQDKLGNSKIYSGQQLYIKLNQNLLNIGFAPISVPKLPTSFEEILAVSITSGIVLKELFVQASVADVPLDTYLVVEATDKLSAGVSKPKNGDFKKISLIPDGDQIDAQNLYDDYVSRFGTPDAGTSFFIRIKQVSLSTGQATTYSMVQGTWSA